MELRRYLSILYRWGWLLVLAVVLGAGASFLVTRSLPPLYQATAKLLVTQGSGPTSSETYSALLSAERLARTYADLIRTRPVLEQAAQRVGLAPTADLSGLIDVRLVRDTQLLQVSAEYPDPAIAADLANVVAQTFIHAINQVQQSRYEVSRDNLARQVDQMQAEIDQRARALDAIRTQPAQTGAAAEATQAEISRLQKEISDFQQTYTNLLRSYEEFRLAEARSLNTVTVVEPAVAPRFPVKPNVRLNTVLAAIIGGLLALGIILLVEYLDDRLSTPERVSQLLNVPVLGLIGLFPKSSEVPLLTSVDPKAGANGADGKNGQKREPGYGYYHSSVGEAYRVLRTNLQFTGVEKALRTIVVTSAGPGEGKSTTAANLALALAQAGFRTLLVDADLRRPNVHRLFKLPNRTGMTTLLLQDERAETYLQATPMPNLRVLTSGPLPPNASELLGSVTMSARLGELTSLADYVIIDTPPALLVSDPLALAPQVDGVLIVINGEKTRSGAALRAYEALEKVGARVVGVVLNRFQYKTRGYYYDYQYYSSEVDLQDAKEAAVETTPTAGGR